MKIIDYFVLRLKCNKLLQVILAVVFLVYLIFVTVKGSIILPKPIAIPIIAYPFFYAGRIIRTQNIGEIIFNSKYKHFIVNWFVTCSIYIGICKWFCGLVQLSFWQLYTFVSFIWRIKFSWGLSFF